MLPDRIEVIQRGDSSGNNMVVKVTLSSGREIYGLATENFYGGDWDLGPTWNYLITADKPFLIDSGRRGTGPKLLELMSVSGFNSKDIGSVVVSHGHEDHDGGLFELCCAIDVPVVAHEVYSHLVKSKSDAAPSPEKADFPASCWGCPMPEAFFSRNCLEYHKERQKLTIVDIEDFRGELGPGIEVYHIPGHCPDSVALVVDGEAILAGDTILPEITPHPTVESHFHIVKPMLPDRFHEAQELFGLRAYIRSLIKLKELKGRANPHLVLPSHRWYYQDKWNDVDLHARIDELVQHHIYRCNDILRILKNGPKTPEEIAVEYFDPDLLKGYGINLGINEIKSHCELMQISGDLITIEDKILATGNENFKTLIGEIAN
jgi:glyoxylase-like metal-dependent hydrolase (beta-lactamase superfamily II)